MNEKLRKFMSISDRIRSGEVVSNSDLKFYYTFAPEINQDFIERVANDSNRSIEDVQAAILEASIALQSSPEYKEQTLKIAQSAEKSELTDKLSTGLNLIMGATDIANSISQISKSNKALASSKKPGRPSVPPRDSYLQQALRGAQDINTGVQAALAPAQAQIRDQYANDIQNAKTAATGQAGAFGAYAQLAANRRNRASTELAPIADSIRARNQNRLDSLIGQRMDESQQMFQNQAQMYPYDLNQYQLEQQAAASLGSTGRTNLRNSLLNFAGQVAPAAASMITKRKYDNLRNKMGAIYGEKVGDIAAKNQEYLDQEYYGYNPFKPETYPQ